MTEYAIYNINFNNRGHWLAKGSYDHCLDWLAARDLKKVGDQLYSSPRADLFQIQPVER